MKFRVHQNIARQRCAWLAIATTLTLPTLSTLICAQQNPCDQRKVFATVEDEKGQVVDGLTAANFHAILGKEIIPVTLAESSPLRRIVILLDQSGSMYDTYKYHAASYLITNLVKQSPLEIQFAFATYSSDFQLKQNITSNHYQMIEKVKQTLSVKAPWGPSATLDALLAGLGLLNPPETGDAVLLVTDGGENDSKINWDDAARHLAGSDVRLFAAVVTPQYRTGVLQEYETKETRKFKKMFEDMGGEIFWLGSDYPSRGAHPKNIVFHISVDCHDIPKSAADILQFMEAGYRLQISPIGTFTKPVDWKLEVTNGSRAKATALFVRYPPKLFPCSATSSQK